MQWSHQKARVRTMLVAAGLLFLLTILLQPFASSATVPEAASPADAVTASADQTTLEEFGKLEADILQRLHALQVEIGADVLEVQSLTAESDALKDEVETLAKRMDEETARLEANKLQVRKILVRYEMAGPGSQVEVLLASVTLSEFLQRLSILREMNRQTGVFLARLAENRRVLEEQRSSRAAVLMEMESKRVLLEQTLAGKKQRESELEASLASLAEDRTAYEARLDQLNLAWADAQNLFPKLSKGFSAIVTEGAFPQDALEMGFSLSGVIAGLQQGTFQKILSGDRRMLGVVFRFHKDRVTMEMPDLALVLDGTFEVEEGKTLVYRVESGTQQDIALELVQLAALSAGGDLRFELEPLLQGGAIRKIKLQEGELLLDIAISLF